MPIKITMVAPSRTRASSSCGLRRHMTGDDGEGLADPAVGDRDAAGRRYRQRAGDARDDADGHPGLDAGQHLLPAATEHERIAALEPDHRLSPAGAADHLILDRGLGHRMVVRSLADVDQLGARRRAQPDRRWRPTGRRSTTSAWRSAAQASRVSRLVDPGPPPTSVTLPSRGAGSSVDDQHVQVAGQFADPLPERAGQAHIDDQPGGSDQPEQPGRVGRRRSEGVPHGVDPVGVVGQRRRPAPGSPCRRRAGNDARPGGWSPDRRRSRPCDLGHQDQSA